MRKKFTLILLMMLALVLLAVPASSQLNQKLTELTETTGPATSDLLYVVVDPSGTPLSRKATIDNVVKSVTLTIPYTAKFPMAGCADTTAASVWDLPTSSAAAPECATGSNIQKGVLTFTNGTSAQMSWVVPQSITGTVAFRLVWLSAQTSSTGTWTLNGICTATDATATDDPSFSTFWSPSQDTSPGTASRLKTTTGTSVSWPASCSAGKLLHMKLSWAAGSASSFQAIELTMTYNLSVTQ